MACSFIFPSPLPTRLRLRLGRKERKINVDLLNASLRQLKICKQTNHQISNLGSSYIDLFIIQEEILMPWLPHTTTLTLILRECPSISGVRRAQGQAVRLGKEENLLIAIMIAIENL